MDCRKYSERLELDVEEGSPEEVAIKVVMQEGALRFQDQVVEILNKHKQFEAVKLIEQAEFNV